MSWRLARSLETLRGEIRARHPGTTVWTIGDQAHAAGASDHNPNAAGVVCAIDVLADGGLDLGEFAEHLRQLNHVAVKYVIFNRRIWSKQHDSDGWRSYHGSNPHTSHVHVSVGVGLDGRSTGPYDNTSPWGWAGEGAVTAPSGSPPLRVTTPMTQAPRVGQLQRALNDLGENLTVDDWYGQQTASAVRRLQQRAGITGDGIYGPQSQQALSAALAQREETPVSGRDVWEYRLPWTDDWVRDRWGMREDGWRALTMLQSVYGHSRRGAEEGRQRGEILQAILAAVTGADTGQILDRIESHHQQQLAAIGTVEAALEAAEERAAAERAELADLVRQAQSGELAAEAVVDELARRLAGPQVGGDQDEG